MTKLSDKKCRTRYETDASVFEKKHRAVMLELFPDRVELRLKGTRRSYAGGYAELYDILMKKARVAAAEARRLAKKAAKKGFAS